MTQKEFFDKIDDMGIDLVQLRIVIGKLSGRSGVHGIYEKDGQWVYYFADDRNHIDEEIIGTEEKAFDKMFQDVFLDLDLEEYIHRPITEDIVKIDKQTVCQFICKTYSMSEQKANDMWNNLKWDMHVLFEFKYYVANNQFVPDKFCYKVKGYSAEQLYKTTNLTPLGTYNYLIYLQKKPEEALADLEVRKNEELKPYQEQLQNLWTKGMYYSGEKKSFVGKVNGDLFFQTPCLVTNKFGYYLHNNGTWVVFVTDEERGVETFSKPVSTEKDAVTFLSDFAESNNFSYFYDQTMNDFDEPSKLIVMHLRSQYGYSPEKAQRMLNHLLQVRAIAFEYWYVVKYGHFVPDKFAEIFSGYSAKHLQQKFHMTDIKAFSYMIYLKKTPDEALAELQKRNNA